MTNAVPKKKKLTKQQIAIYVISALVVISMAVSLLVSGNSRRAAVPTTAPIDIATPAPAEATAEPTAE